MAGIAQQRTETATARPFLSMPEALPRHRIRYSAMNFESVAQNDGAILSVAMVPQEAEALELRLERDQAAAQAGRLSKYLQELFEADPAQISASYGEQLFVPAWAIKPLVQKTRVPRFGVICRHIQTELLNAHEGLSSACLE